jgi:hypothetical protein
MNASRRPDRSTNRYNGIMAKAHARSRDTIPPAARGGSALTRRRQGKFALVPDPLDENALAAAYRLYQATLDLLSASDDPARDRHVLAGPLSTVVARQKTRIGQADCAELALALAAADHAAALDACRRLIELEKQ